MIAVTTRGKSFRALVAYVLRERNAVEQDAVAWRTARNLPTADPELAVRFMSATAAQNARAQKPSYHIALSFGHEDAVDRTIMERVSNRLLEGLGLSEHQALLVAHRDRPNQHVHLIANLVHPETARVWNTWCDWRRARQVLDREEHALGLRHVPHRLTKVDALARELETLERVVTLIREQYQVQMEVYGARAREQLLTVTLDQARHAEGRRDEWLARVYRDAEQAYQAYARTALAQGPRVASRLMRQRPEQFGALALVERTRALGLWRTLDDGPARAAVPAAATAAEQAFEAAGAWAREAESTAHRVEQAFEQTLGGIYAEPAAARAAFERVAAERGTEAAAATLRERPEALGMMRTTTAENGRPLGDQLGQAARYGVEAVQVRTTAMVPVRAVDVERLLTHHRFELDQATARQDANAIERAKLPARDELERRLSLRLELLLPHEVRLLRTTLTAPRLALAAQLNRSIRDIALGRHEELDQSPSRDPA